VRCRWLSIVRVEHMHVHEVGQAVIGNVKSTGQWLECEAPQHTGGPRPHEPTRTTPLAGNAKECQAAAVAKNACSLASKPSASTKAPCSVGCGIGEPSGLAASGLQLASSQRSIRTAKPLSGHSGPIDPAVAVD